MRNEICYILVGKQRDWFWKGRLIKKAIGTSSSVEFDWRWVLKREEKKGDVLGFWHTHLDDLKPSKRDWKTMTAWVDCFGKPLLCVIQNSDRTRAYIVTPMSNTYALLSAYNLCRFLRSFRAER